MFNLSCQLASQAAAEQTNWNLKEGSIPSPKVTFILNKCATTNLSELNESEEAPSAATPLREASTKMASAIFS